ncbi:MAG: phosphoenolpyruvate mutase [Lentisphaerae bacterium RIFOXYB12_FULL_65_16]|nr:MAG: phosphoenolpyruvate mutase [Lentisphaerae bacterium RIFOXYA12_64_32]OGV87231.1 MAG: phosphoenolpyruvate mutase [Lentisphaerae bacterium RIFOXYB12_FULL_65_16]
MTDARKTARLRQLIARPELTFLMEAHNGLSARIAQDVGFEGLWASGLSISAALGVRDNNEASWTQVLEVVEFMSDATQIPILLDGDTGYGNFNNVRRLVRKLEQRQVAGVCIEDKLFPKTNSYIRGEQQPLADVDEFCGRIAAGKDAQTDPDFVIVARTEAFIAGWGLDEALRRAEAYRRAGADAILVHSKKSTASDIELFMKEWQRRLPVIIVPTTYYSTPTERFRELGVAAVIWANHGLRGALWAMQDVYRQIHRDQSLVNVEDRVAPMADVFRLQGAQELLEDERRYLPSRTGQYRAVILAAGQGAELDTLTRDQPKCLLPINNKPVLTTLIGCFNEVGVKDVVVVRGFGKELLVGPNYRWIDNDEHATTRDLYSLYLARGELDGPVLISYGDIILRKYLVEDLLNMPGGVAVVIDADLRAGGKRRDLALCSEPYSNAFFNRRIQLRRVWSGSDISSAHGQWPGILAATATGTESLRRTLNRMAETRDIRSLSVTDLLQELTAETVVDVVYCKGGWIGINDVSDYQQAGRFQ